MTPEDSVDLIKEIQNALAGSNTARIDNRVDRFEQASAKLVGLQKAQGDQNARFERDMEKLTDGMSAVRDRATSLEARADSQQGATNALDGKVDQTTGRISALEGWKDPIEKRLDTIPSEEDLSKRVDSQVNRWVLPFTLAGVAVAAIAFVAGMVTRGETPATEVAQIDAPVQVPAADPAPIVGADPANPAEGNAEDE